MAEDIAALVQWFTSKGGTIKHVKLQDLGGEMSLSIVTTAPLDEGQPVLRIPLSCCITVDSILADTDYKHIWRSLAPLPADEILAIYLVLERSKGTNSRYAEYIK